MLFLLCKIKEYFNKAVNKNLKVGIFCPGRAINLLYFIKPGINLRFFDDHEKLHGHYFPPFNIPIESRDSLLNDPVNLLLIMSTTFGEEIKKELLQDNRIKNVDIKLYSELTDII